MNAATSRPTPFAFSSDFGSNRETRRIPMLEAEIARLTAEVAAAEQRGYDAGRAVGYASGRDDALVHEAQRASGSAARIVEVADRLVGGLEQERALLSREAVEIALLAARKFADASLARAPTAAVEQLFSTCLSYARGAPHLVVRVPPDLVEKTEALTKRMAFERGFTGRIVVLGDPDTQQGDALIEWADGGIGRSRHAIDAAIATAVNAYFTAPSQPSSDAGDAP